MVAKAIRPPGLERVVRCDLCSATDFAPRAVYTDYLLFTEDEHRLVTCRRCGLHFINPRPDAGTIAAYYPDDYIPHQKPRRTRLAGWELKAGGEPGAARSVVDRLTLHVMQSVSWYLIPPRHGDRKILDVGCGSGRLLDTMRLLGWDTYGVEPSPAAVQRAVDAGHQAVVGTAEEAHFEPESFDVVYLWHVLEHTHSPRRALANCRRYLKPGGKLVMAVPNFNSFHSRLFGRYWWSTDAPRHLFQFTRRTIRAYLDELGFADVRVASRTGASSWLRGFRHTVNGVLGTRWRTDHAWMLALCEAPVVLSSLFGFFGVGSELRIVAAKPPT